MTYSPKQLSLLREALQVAVVKCSERCLYQSAKWVAELLDSFPESMPPAEHSNVSEGLHNSNYIHPTFLPNADPREAALEAKELNKYLLAKTFFDCKEFDRCAAVFLPDSLLSGLLSTKLDEGAAVQSRKGKGKAREALAPLPSEDTFSTISQKSLFLALYAKVMSGEKQKNEETEMIMGPQDLGSVVNKQLVVVGRFLQRWFHQRKNDTTGLSPSQGFLEYLYGMVLVKERNEEAAKTYLIDSVILFPWNWGCWLEITNLISRPEEMGKFIPHLPQDIMSFIFYAHTAVSLYQHGDNLADTLNDLLNLFPTSGFLLTCKAMLIYHSKDLLTAEQEFSQIVSMHPHRLESLDHYSNILYVLNMRPKLAFLAHLSSSVDKFRPESCVVVGNYYALLSMHEKAVQYFRRALTLDRTFLSAWTLMGHEYVELKNTHAAIESYRRAVDVNRRDYRAWYGLGQTYEVLEMHAYALWYYKKAAGLRPWDAKMWQAVGTCLEKMGRDHDGIKALKRALLADNNYDASGAMINVAPASAGGLSDPAAQMDPEVVLQIANMYDRIGEEDNAKLYMELCLAQEEGLALGAKPGGAPGTEPGGAPGAGESGPAVGDSSMLSAGGAGGENEAGPSKGPADESLVGGGSGGGGGGGEKVGTGVTAATSKARMWLARFAMRAEDYATASRLATELCEDGVEVEEARALIREARSRVDIASVVD